MSHDPDAAHHRLYSIGQHSLSIHGRRLTIEADIVEECLHCIQLVAASVSDSDPWARCHSEQPMPSRRLAGVGRLVCDLTFQGEGGWGGTGNLIQKVGPPSPGETEGSVLSQHTIVTLNEGTRKISSQVFLHERSLGGGGKCSALSRL